MNASRLKKLGLNQETLRNLSQRGDMAGRSLSVPHINCLTGLTCPECNPPARQN
jgi:hypothetical protein